MFTGLVEGVGRVHSTLRGSQSMELVIKQETLAREAQTGESVAVNGVCLTVTSFGRDEMRFDVMTTTWEATNLAQLQPGSLVNLERALKLGDRLGGHWVTGHVDTTVSCVGRRPHSLGWTLEFQVPSPWTRYLVDKGSVCLDGVSLTISELKQDRLCVSLIPETLRSTTLGSVFPGHRVNLECDILAKHVEKLLGVRS